MNQQQQPVISLQNYAYMEKDFFLYFPIDNEIMYRDSKLVARRIYEGQILFSQEELDKIEEFRLYLQKHKYIIDPWWQTHNLMRVLYANKFKFDQSYKSIVEYMDWRHTKLPPILNSKVEQFLKEGLVYVNGRDNRYRPIVIINASLLENKKKEIDLLLDTLTYLFEFILDQYMLPGQIENWVVILDTGKLGITGLPSNVLQKLMSYLSNSYRSRMYVCYIVNCTKTITFAWNLIKGQLEESTVKKINFFSSNVPTPLFNHCHQSQVEQKYGGEFQNIISENFWPPKIPSRQYLLDDDENISISLDEYLQIYKQGKLRYNKVLDHLIKEVKQSEPNLQSKINSRKKNIHVFIEKSNFNLKGKSIAPTNDEYQEQKQQKDIEMQWLKSLLQPLDDDLSTSVYMEEEGCLPQLQESAYKLIPQTQQIQRQKVCHTPVSPLSTSQLLTRNRHYKQISDCFQNHKKTRLIPF